MSGGAPTRGRKVQCPNCASEVIVGSGRSGQRVKCPKCTAPIPTDLANPEGKVKTPEHQLGILMEHIARLESRVTALEQLKPDEQSPPIEQNCAPAPATAKLKWLRSGESAPVPIGLMISDPLHEQALVHNLRALPGSKIIIRSSTNEHARRLAERFKELFAEAEWDVNGVAELPYPARWRGLSLAGGALPPSRETTRTFLALTAAGFSVESRLDLTLQSDDTMLIVA